MKDELKADVSSLPTPAHNVVETLRMVLLLLLCFSRKRNVFALKEEDFAYLIGHVAWKHAAETGTLHDLTKRLANASKGRYLPCRDKAEIYVGL